jgi:hypothetical protein
VTKAKAVATIRDGKVVSIKVTRGGAGYNSNPTAKIPGFPSIKLSIKRHYGAAFAKNGSIRSLRMI